MLCPNCQTPNRESAKYCKKCGTRLEVHFLLLNQLVGLEEIKNEIKKIIQVLRTIQQQKKAKLNFHTLLVGNCGTGKTTVAEILTSVFLYYGVISDKKPVFLDAIFIDDFLSNIENAFQQAKGSILYLDNIHLVIENTGFVERLLRYIDLSKNDPIVFALGHKKAMANFVKNQRIQTYFRYILQIEDYNEEELTAIAEKHIEKYNVKLSPGARLKLKASFEKILKTKKDDFANAREAIKQAEDILSRYYYRISTDPQADPSFIEEVDVTEPGDGKPSLDAVLKELDGFIGMEEIKKEIRALIHTLEIQKEKARIDGKPYRPGVHFVFSGNPGTGKTTIARVLGNVFAAMDLLPSGHVVEVDRSKLIASYVGQTAPQVQKVIDDALGGILFIDEAYTLYQGQNDTYGKEAIDTLLKRMEDDRGKFITIIAGYPEEINDFLNTNPGLRSRFTHYFHFEDYRPAELLQIFLNFARKHNYQVEEEAKKQLQIHFEKLYLTRTKNFGNGREARKLFEEVVKRQAQRLMELPPEKRKEELFLIRKEDLPEIHGEAKDLKATLDALNSLVGLKSVKEEIQALVRFLEVEKLRRQHGIPGKTLNLHFVFTGNPGTGKTTVARLLGDIFRELGILATGHLVETDRSGLVAEYLGQTAIKTNRIIDKAMGGILFIDEAYTLTPAHQNDGYGKEAVDTLLKRMEDDRGKFIVIVAGYKKDMERFLNSNEGLRSRFTRFIDFEDYNPEELTEIFKFFAKKNAMELEEGAEEVLYKIFDILYRNRDASFANGRTVRNFFEKVLQAQSQRVLETIAEPSREDLVLITKSDLEHTFRKEYGYDLSAL